MSYMKFLIQNRRKLISNSILVLLIFLIASSCVTQRQIEYFQTKNSKGNIENYPNNSFEDYILKPNDELYVQISSLDDASANIYSSGNSIPSTGNLNAYGASLMSHTIDKDGFLELPVIGKIPAKDKTIYQVKLSIKEALSNILNQPVVSVKLVNRYISVLGEVRNPGHFVYSQEKLSIFDAIGIAGDVTDYGNRKNVILIRNENNVNIRTQLSLLEPEILSSNYYFLRPGDIIYIKPMKNKFWGLRQFPYATLISSITATILVLNFIDNNN